MAKVNVCDRCGEIISKHYDNRYFLMKWDKDGVRTTVSTPVDLCENCQKSLENWLKEMKIGDVESM